MMKKITLLLFVICHCAASYAQFDYPSLSSNQQLIEEALSGGICLIARSYQLKETKSGNLYGRGGRNEFGTSYTIGIRVPGGFYLVDKAVRPWEYDQNYNQYRGEAYEPVISATAYLTIGDTLGYQPLETDGDVQAKMPQTIYELKSRNAGTSGFATATLAGKVAGWMVWISSEKQADLDATPKLTYHIYRKELTVGNKPRIAVDAPQTSQQILGGIYVVPEQTGVGQITFRVNGILIEKNDAWKIVFPFDPQASGAAVTMEEAENRQESSVGELTPVSIKKGDQKAKDKKKK